MNSEQQTLAELPIWMVIVLSLVGGVSGEMWREDMAGARGWGLIRRLALRSGACVTCGLSTNMLLYALCIVHKARRAQYSYSKDLHTMTSPIIPWMGGKRRLADRLIPLFPPP
ncbi:phage holin family protein [Pseudomonas sp. FGI182]|uniref:phage holin family protein n=1 Tax=Pseudomonas sp. FGI182 TaxID=1259844 RepID=UPI00046CD3F3|nr:phage holin family protein [Pseudomonas sp. FGI182]